MKFFVKKISEESLHVLNEEDIQKKLYGTYHKVQTNSASHKAPIYATLGSKPYRPWANINFKPIINLVLQWVKSFPWKVALLSLAGIVFAVYSLQFISNSFQSLTKPKVKNEQVVTTNEPVNQKSDVSKPATVQKSTHKLASVDLENQTAVSLRKTYYAVQVCTYQKLSDALNLVAELKRAHFPAFHMRIPASQSKIPYYVVFLGKDAEYAQANAKLKEFRRSDQRQKFPDAFIRSI